MEEDTKLGLFSHHTFIENSRIHNSSMHLDYDHYSMPYNHTVTSVDDYDTVTVGEDTVVAARLVSSWHDRLITVAQFCAIGGLGGILNFLPLALTLCTRLRRHEVNIMIMNLSSADFLLCVSFVFGQTFYILWHEELPSAGCHFLSFFHFTMAFASFIFPPVLAINRYISLYHNHAYRKIYTKRRVAQLIISCWIFCSLVPFVFMLAGKTGYDEDNHHCCMVLHGDIPWTVAYWIVIITPLIVFCDGTMIYCNYKIYIKLNEHASHQNLDKNVIRKNKEVLYFLIADMMFPICFHSIYHIFKFILINRTNEFLKRFFISLYLVNSVLRGIVTLAMLRPYRSALRHMIFGTRGMKRVPTSENDSRSYNRTIRVSTYALKDTDQSENSETTKMALMSIREVQIIKNNGICETEAVDI